MRILYIGTGAADWTAAAGARDGISRRFTCTLLDRELLIDFAPTTPRELFVDGGALSNVTDILYTHSHDDHYDSETLAALAHEKKIRVWADADFAARIPRFEGVEVYSLIPGEAVQIGKYEVIPLRANHALRNHPHEQALHYIISDGSAKIFWGADGAWFLTETWREILRHAPYDRIILDGTLGETFGDKRIFEHNSLPMIREIKAVLIESNCLKEHGQVWLTHLSRDAHETPKRLRESCLEMGLYVAQDESEDFI